MIINKRQEAFAAATSGKVKITEEEKKRWAPMLWQTWGAIAPDAEGMLSRGARARQAEIIELCLDANRMTMFSDITPEEEGVLCGLWVSNDKPTMTWLRKTLNY